MILGQIDVLLAVQGLSSILMATVAWSADGGRAEARSWRWFAGFGIVYGLASWLEMLSLSVADASPLQTACSVLYVGAFLLLFESARVRLNALLPAWGIWIFAPPLGAYLLWYFTSLNWLLWIAWGLLVGASSGAVASLLWQSATPSKGLLRSAIRFSAACLGLFGLWSMMLGPPVPVHGHELVDNSGFIELTGFSVRFFPASLITLCAVGLWIAYRQIPLYRSMDRTAAIWGVHAGRGRGAHRNNVGCYMGGELHGRRAARADACPCQGDRADDRSPGDEDVSPTPRLTRLIRSICV